ncbi:MAG: purine-binding chemotaxis protein CheW [Anaerolineae bacterium]|nr:purine-binding chemotaxis protein CheW [Anaerolineae bacterium]
MEEQLVVFELNKESYGVNVKQVQSIIPMQDIVSVPNAPMFIEGVVNLRGSVIPVVDLRTRFGLPQPPPPDNAESNGKKGKKKQVIVISELDDLLVGLIVDKVTEVIRIAEENIEPPSPLLASVDTAYLRGIGKFRKKAEQEERVSEEEDKLVILLDLDRVFSRDEQQALTQAV